ncbi:hexosaminidase D-like [Panonychus citri]|uniref:hexosaminidase D-like n=1 Tax=Panonychus citri TaxID=50023 RepID=UPI0023076FAE|nr:hexosaminidase D-like [Panonychus citri]
MRPICYYMLTSLWKRKPLLLAIVMVASFTVIALQYNSVSDSKRNSLDPQISSSSFNPHSTRNNVNSYSQDSQSLPRRNLSALGLDNGNINHNKTTTIRMRMRMNEDDPNNLSDGGDSSDKRQSNSPVSSSSIAAPYESFGGKYSHLFTSEDKNSRIKKDGERNSYYVPPFRLVHFDLKGAPPKMSYLKSILELVKEAGATGILVEYEDMFPYEGYLSDISAKNAYTKQEIDLLLKTSEQLGLDVIPLIPTFGHMEFVLKSPKFRHLREYDPYPMALCPSQNETFFLIQQMVDQIMSAHPNIKWLHIGCDEVFQIAYCDKCRNSDRDTLFLNHVIKVAKYVRSKHSVIPIVWDDMLRNMSPERLKESKIGSLVEPMIWTYVKDIYRFIPYPTFTYFADTFDNVWAASAFKGAFGETLTVPNVKMHLENNEGWLEVMAEQHGHFKSFRGIVVTGWQRYDHLGTLCELLPSGLPSLIIDLITLKNGHFDVTKVFKEFDKIMKCSSSSSYSNNNNQYGYREESNMIGSNNGNTNGFDFESDPYLYNRASNCLFPGSSIFKMTQTVADAVKRVNDYIYDVTIHKAWLTDYNVRHNVSNPYRVDEGLEQHSNVHFLLTSALRSASSSLREAFDEFTVNEWIEQNIYPYLLKMEKVLKDGENLKKSKVWPRRPYPPLPDMKRFGL